MRIHPACDDELLFSFADGAGTLHLQDDTFTLPQTWDDQHSPLAAVLRDTSNERLRRYRAWWRRTIWTANLGIDDFRQLTGAAEHPGPHYYRFVPWYRHWAETEPQRVTRLDNDLATVLPAFARLEADDENLYALFTSPEGEPTKVTLDDLAHGERVLIHLYAFIHLAPQTGRTLWIAAPKASIPAAAIAAWLQRALAYAEDASCQLIVTVNEPEALGGLPTDAVRRFDRHDGGPTSVSLGPSQ